MSDATMNELYKRTGLLWWLFDAASSMAEIFAYIMMFEWWKPTTWLGKVIKLPLKIVGTFVAIPFSLPATGLAVAWFQGGGAA